jgi:hypothetical protein
LKSTADIDQNKGKKVGKTRTNQLMQTKDDQKQRPPGAEPQIKGSNPQIIQEDQQTDDNKD